MRENMQSLSFLVTSLKKFTDFLRKFHFSLAEQNSIVYMEHIFMIYLSPFRHLCSLSLLL